MLAGIPSFGYALKVPYDSPYPPAEYNRGVRVLVPMMGTGTVMSIYSFSPLLYVVRMDGQREQLIFHRSCVNVVATR